MKAMYEKKLLNFIRFLGGFNMKKLILNLVLITLLFFITCMQPSKEKAVNTQTVHTYNLRQFYPFPFNKVFHYGDISNPQVKNALIFSRWGEDDDDDPYNGDFTFTIHHIYYPQEGNWQDYWCPRIDDVMQWKGRSLCYSDTYSFYSPAHHTILSPAHIWADEYMIIGNVLSHIITHAANNLAHNTCGNTVDGTPIHSYPYTHIFRSLALETTDWSPCTGGESNPVPVVRLDEVTYIRNTSDAPYDDFFKEEWFFTLMTINGSQRYIPIHTLGYHRLQNGSMTDKWDLRLLEITDR
jgi:hypothetical protein